MNKPDHSSGSALTERIFDLLEQAELADDAAEMRQLLNLIDDESALSTEQQISLYYYRSQLVRLKGNLKAAEDEALIGLSLAEKYQLTIPASRMNFTLGCLYVLGGYSGKAITCLEKALTLLKDSGKLYLESEVRTKLSTAYFISGNYSLALEEAETSLELRRQNNDSHGEAFSLWLVGRVYNRIGRCQEARKLFIEAASIFRRFGDAANEAPLLITLGSANRNLGRLNEAEQVYRRAIEMAKERDLQAVMANATNNLGNLYSRRGNLDAALENYQSALKMYQRQGSTINAGLACSNIAGMLTRRGEYVRAEEICREVLASYNDINHRSGIGTILFDLGIIQFLRGRIEDGQTSCNQAIEIVTELGEHRRIHHFLHELAWFLTVYQKPDLAARCFARADEYLPKEAEVENSQFVLAVRAWHQFNLGNAEKSLALAETALRQSEEKGKTIDTSLAHLIRGRALLSMGRLDEAGKELLTTRQGYIELQMPFYETLSCRALADYYHKVNQSEKRDAIMKEGLSIARRIGAAKLTPWFERMLDDFVYKG